MVTTLRGRITGLILAGVSSFLFTLAAMADAPAPEQASAPVEAGATDQLVVAEDVRVKTFRSEQWRRDRSSSNILVCSGEYRRYNFGLRCRESSGGIAGWLGDMRDGTETSLEQALAAEAGSPAFIKTTELDRERLKVEYRVEPLAPGAETEGNSAVADVGAPNDGAVANLSDSVFFQVIVIIIAGVAIMLGVNILQVAACVMIISIVPMLVRLLMDAEIPKVDGEAGVLHWIAPLILLIAGLVAVGIRIFSELFSDRSRRPVEHAGRSGGMTPACVAVPSATTLSTIEQLQEHGSKRGSGQAQDETDGGAAGEAVESNDSSGLSKGRRKIILD